MASCIARSSPAVLMAEEPPDPSFPHFAHLQSLKRRFASTDAFFAAGNLDRELLAKQVALELSVEEAATLSWEERSHECLTCPVVGCGARFVGMGAFEEHYAARHKAVCSVCKRVYPTGRLLSLHVSEAHDAFFQAKVARGYPMYECLVEGCGAKFMDDVRRHQHLVDRHQFPRSFRFHAPKKHPSQKQRRKLHPHQTPARRSVAAPMEGVAESSSKVEQQQEVGQSADVANKNKAAGSNRRARRQAKAQATAPTAAGNTAQGTAAGKDTPAGLLAGGLSEKGNVATAQTEEAGSEQRPGLEPEGMDLDDLTASLSRLSTVSSDSVAMPSAVCFGRRSRGGGRLGGSRSRGRGQASSPQLKKGLSTADRAGRPGSVT